MARKPENTFIDSVHKLLPKELHAEKMNNPYRSGCADVWYSGKQSDLWVEYKYIPKLPVENAIKANLSPLQTKWLRERYREGRKVFVVIGSPLGGVILADLTWENPISLSDYRKQTITRQSLADWLTANTLGLQNGTNHPSRRERNIRNTRKVVTCDERE